jgi:DHA1 family bicyclomycin/chloramphenicol resistance-like MFS transporter
LGATPVQMQQTLSAYLFGFAFMSCFMVPCLTAWAAAGGAVGAGGVHPDIGWLCLVAKHWPAGVFRAVQGLTTGAGIVVSRAVVRDMFAPAQAQKVMSQITIYFGVAPAVRTDDGRLLFDHLGWHSVFWFLTAVGVVLWLANYRLLPETCTKAIASRCISTI